MVAHCETAQPGLCLCVLNKSLQQDLVCMNCMPTKVSYHISLLLFRVMMSLDTSVLGQRLDFYIIFRKLDLGQS